MVDDPEKTAPGVVVLLVDTEVVGESVDPLSEKGDLHFGRTGIPGVSPEIIDDLLLGLGGNQPSIPSIRSPDRTLFRGHSAGGPRLNGKPSYELPAHGERLARPAVALLSFLQESMRAGF